MIKLKTFVFGPFQENTYVLWNKENRAWIIDPGMSNRYEEEEFLLFVKKHSLKPEKVLLTHGHIDHVYGCNFVYETFELVPEIHSADLFWTEKLPDTCRLYGMHPVCFPEKKRFLDSDAVLDFGQQEHVQIFHVPGHSPGSVAFYFPGQKVLISGDVLFAGSIGRTDFPGGSYDTLLQSVRNKIFVLPDDVQVFSGHGPKTTVGNEKKYNPFFQ